MRNFNESSIIGGEELNPGSKFDSFNMLIDRYYALLFFTLAKSGITYSTGRNGALARVRFEEKGFVNYVQPCTGKWNYNDPKYQRVVSPDFVLYLFNNICMAESLYRINELSEPIQINGREQVIPEGIDLNEFSVSNIIKLHEEYEEEYFKYKNGQPNYYEQISKSNLAFINLSYSLLERVTKYSREFAEHQVMVAKATELKQDVENGAIDYYKLNEKEQELVDESYYSGEFDACPEYYLSLGYFNNCIRKHALEQIYSQKKKMDKLKGAVSPNELETLGVYDDPIAVEYDGYDELEGTIDYANAKEFEYGNSPKIERRNPTRL